MTLTLAGAPTACLFEPGRLGPLDESTSTDDSGTDDSGTDDSGTDDSGTDDAAETSEADVESAEASTTDGEAACFVLDEPCVQGADCCDFDPSFPPGSSQCVQIEQQAQCTTICFGPEDCETACCAALEGITAYGACVSASLCGGG